VYRRRNRACESGALTWWQPGAIGDVPFRSGVRQRSFSFSTSGSETFEDGASLEWTARATVRRIAYRAVDCNRTPWC
jgi:hypothetical protein